MILPYQAFEMWAGSGRRCETFSSHMRYHRCMTLDREQLLRAAADFLGRRPNATQDEIAAAVGVSRATLHRHFAGRAALLEALDELAVAQMDQALKTARLQEDSAIEALRRLVTVLNGPVRNLAGVMSQIADQKSKSGPADAAPAN